MNIQEFAVSRVGTRFWLLLGRLPPRAGHAFGRWVARQLYLRKHAFAYRTLYANQTVVLGPAAAAEQVDAAVAAALYHAGMSQYDIVHAIARGREAIIDSIELGADFWPHLQAARATGRGVLLCGVHLSAFNLGLLAFALCGDTPIQILSAARGEGGFRLISDLRNRGAIEETPVDGPALRQAIQRLRAGGIALIGVDWPVPLEAAERIPFFGRPAGLPTGYMRMALNANAVLLPIACRWTPERGYYIMAAPHMEPERTGDRAHDIQHNVRRLLNVAEGWIRETPDQWLMYYRVWPDE